MIETTKRRIIFCGNYRWWQPEWHHLDGDNSDMTADEFFGSNYMTENIIPNREYYVDMSNGNTERYIATNRMKLNWVIDSSEYVVRCDFGKTSVRASGFDYNGMPSCSFGTKTDILGLWLNHVSNLELLIHGKSNIPRLLELEHPCKNYMSSANHFADQTVKKGIPSYYHKGQSLTSDMSDFETEQKMSMILEYYGNNAIASFVDVENKNESWVNMNWFYHRFIDYKYEWKKEYPNTKKQYIEHYKKMMDSIECQEDVHGINIKLLDMDTYIELCNEVHDCSISYKELKEMIYHKEWAQGLFEYHDNPDWMKDEDSRIRWMDWVKTNGHVNRGLEFMYAILTDSRFDDYDKYIIGVMGINECHKIAESCPINQWGEYLWMSKYISDGKLKYLPSHVESLYEDYHKDVSLKGFNLNQGNYR